MSHWTATTTLLAGILAIGLSGPALSVEKPRLSDTPKAQGPIFNPKTDSYFELRIDNGHADKRAWGHAKKQASGLFYKERRGRLAVVKDLETLEFIKENFRLNENAWIGLRFYCSFRKLVWVTGETHPNKSPGMWAPTWYRNKNITCRSQTLVSMGISLTSERTGGVAFQASGPNKAFRSYFVEYPALPAKPTETDTSAKEAK